MNNVMMIPTEYNMKKSFTKDYERLRKKCNRAIVQRNFYFWLFIASLSINIALIYFIIDILSQSIKLAG